MFVILPKFLGPSLAILTAVCISLSVWLSFNGSSIALAQDAAPAQPTGLAVSSEGFHSITIAWDDPQDDSITGYQVLRRSRDGDTYGDGQGAWEFVAIDDDTGTADAEYTDGTVTPHTRYVYRIKARNSAGLSERSSYANAETLGPPARPTGLSISSASHDSVTVAWDDPQDSSISGYQVLRRSRDGDAYGDGQGASEFVAVEETPGRRTPNTLTSRSQQKPGTSTGLKPGTRRASASVPATPTPRRPQPRNPHLNRPPHQLPNRRLRKIRRNSGRGRPPRTSREANLPRSSSSSNRK